MSADKRKFETARRQYLAAKEAESTYRLETLLRKYGSARPSESWITRGEREKIQGYRSRQDRASASMMTLLERLSPRDWDSTVPQWWIMETLSWEDATTSGQMSVTPPPAYGYIGADSARFAAPVAVETTS
jgi:hypothetical protein